MVLLLFFATHANSADVLTDSFESGDLTSPSAGSWGAQGEGSGDSIDVSNDTARTGNYSLKFVFAGGSGDAYAEQGFSFETTATTVYASFYVFWPSNYVHRDDEPSNNKFLMVWGPPGQTGSFFYDLELEITEMHPKTAGNGSVNTCAVSSASTIRPATWGHVAIPENLNTWEHYYVEMKQDSGSGDGFFRVYVDDVLRYEKEDITSVGAPCSPGYFNSGYLFGWANSGFTNDTVVYVDDVHFTDTPQAIGDAATIQGITIN